MTIVVLDSGVRISHPFFEGKDIESYELKEKSIIRVYNDNDVLGHGTAVTYLICKSLHEQNIKAKIVVIKCFEEHNTTETKITNALMAVINDFDADIVNLSFGITKVCIPELEYLCKKLSTKAILISSADNTGYFSFPCILPDVYGVVSDSSCKKQLEYSYIDNAPVQIGAFGNKQRVAWIEQDYIIASGNSFACANATGIVAGVISNQRIENLNDVLKKNASRVSVIPPKKESINLPLFEMKKVAIFPFNKETSSLVLFEDLLKFEIVNIFDSAVTGKVGARVSQILKLPVENDGVIKNITDFNTESIDTLILGHCNEYFHYAKEVEKIEKMLSKCFEQKINIYSFDAIVDTNNVFAPKVTKDDVPPQINGGMMYQILSPVLGIYGTSSKQGKFTLQLSIRRELLKRGFNVGQLGTEPQSLLFSFDSVYPMGYNSTVQISGYDSISYLNRELHRIESCRPIDIIVTGSQSSTVPFLFSHLNQFTLSCIDFLMGTCPDAVILCVNCFDSISYIRRTINFLEGLVDCKVIALVVFPVDRSQDLVVSRESLLNLDAVCLSLQSEFNIPAYILNEDITLICNTIVDYFQ